MKDDSIMATGIVCSKREPSKMLCKLFAIITMMMASSMAFAVSLEDDSMSLDRMLSGALVDGLCGTLSYASSPLSSNVRESIVRCAWFASERDKPAKDVQPLAVWQARHPAFSPQASEQVLLAAWLALKG
ncbi:hypothetical protein ABKU49_05415 [Enterobacter hormaechei]